jgi:SpoVK/Ycf46/Vps4 family AAA+-type ATPase
LKWTGGKSINLLSRIDDITGSVLAEEARAMYFRIANAIVKVDRQVTTQELEAIAVLKESLYPSEEPATLTSREVDEEPSGQPDVIAIIEIRDLDELMQDLESLVGLETVKKDVQELVIFLRDQRSRKSEGLPTLPIPRHLVFFGNPGTGKTTVASLIAAIYASLGIVSRGHLVKADRSRLVAGNLGHTAPKVRQVTESALGGVLFIDDACSLKGAGQDYGQEAIETLLDLIDDYWEDLIVILAGCPEELTSFVGADQDLRSLFIKYFYFEDYSPIELLNIFCLFCKKVGYRLSSKAYQKLSRGFEILYGTRGEDFENASLARYIFEEVINNQANRIISLSDVSEEQLSAIYAADIPEPV